MSPALLEENTTPISITAASTSALLVVMGSILGLGAYIEIVLKLIIGTIFGKIFGTIIGTIFVLYFNTSSDYSTPAVPSASV